MKAEKNRLRWQCTRFSSCRYPRRGVLANTPWYFADGRGTPPRKVATIVLAHHEGKARKEIAELAGVDEKTVVAVIERMGKSEIGDAAKSDDDDHPRRVKRCSSGSAEVGDSVACRRLKQ